MAMTLRLSPELDEKLTVLAAERNVSKQQMVSLALEEAFDRSVYNEKVDAAVDRVMSKYAEAIERLGT